MGLNEIEVTIVAADGMSYRRQYAAGTTLGQLKGVHPGIPVLNGTAGEDEDVLEDGDEVRFHAKSGKQG